MNGIISIKSVFKYFYAQLSSNITVITTEYCPTPVHDC